MGIPPRLWENMATNGREKRGTTPRGEKRLSQEAKPKDFAMNRKNGKVGWSVTSERQREARCEGHQTNLGGGIGANQPIPGKFSCNCAKQGSPRAPGKSCRGGTRPGGPSTNLNCLVVDKERSTVRHVRKGKSVITALGTKDGGQQTRTSWGWEKRQTDRGGGEEIERKNWTQKGRR